MQTIFSLSTFSIFPAKFTITTYLCTQEPCQSSCRQSGRHGALSPLRENNQAGRCTPGCNRRRAGPDPPRRHWLGFEAACRSELGEQGEVCQCANIYNKAWPCIQIEAPTHIHAKKAETKERTQRTTGRRINEELLESSEVMR